MSIAARRPLATGFIALFACSLLLRLWPFLTIEHSWEDAYFFIELARSLSHGKWELLGSFHTKYLPGYPAAILAVHTLLLGTVDWFDSAQLVSLLSSSALAGLCLILVNDVSGNYRAGLAAGIMAMLNGYLVSWSGVPWGEALFSAQILLVIVLAGRAPISAGAMAGLAVVTRHEGWFLAAAFLAAMTNKENRLRPALGLLLMLAIGSAWWVLCRVETGKWLFDIYAEEARARGPAMGASGIDFFILSFPVAGHFATLCAPLGLWGTLRNRTGAAMLGFLAPYLALHAWWMFGVERYFVPIAPLICVLAGCGLDQAERWTRGRFGSRISILQNRVLLPAVGLVFGLIHFIGFAPESVREEATRAEGYVRAVRVISTEPGEFAVMAYDAFLVGYHDNRHTVIPSAVIPDSGLEERISDLYFEQGLRYVLWSDLYPADREKPRLSNPEPFVIDRGTPHGPGKGKMLEAFPTRVFQWTYSYPDRRSWFWPWRRMVRMQRKAIIWEIRPAEPG